MAPLTGPLVAAWIALAAACGGRPEGPDPEGPDVVLVTLDTTRADFLGCYGGTEVATPHLDRLAAEGTRFELAIASSALTPAACASLLTGRYGREHGLRVLVARSGFQLSDRLPTLATALGAKGLETVAVHCALPLYPLFGLERGFRRVETFASPSGRDGADPEASIELALRALAGAGPSFLWIDLWDPPGHLPPPTRFVPDRAAVLAGYADPDSAEAREAWARALYAAKVSYMDHLIGRLLEGLERLGRLDGAILAVTSGHGQGLGDHGWALHRVLYQEQLRVPLIVRAPGLDQVPACDALVRTVDVAPTLLELAGAPVPGGLAGASLRPLLTGAGEPAPRLAFADQLNRFDLEAGSIREQRPQDDFAHVAMDRDWKLIWRPHDPDRSELFQLSTDPGELRDLWSWDHPQAVRLRRALAAEAPWVTAPFRARGELPAEVAERLRARGLPLEPSAGEGPRWEWVCPEVRHPRATEPGPCDHCGAPRMPIAAGR